MADITLSRRGWFPHTQCSRMIGYNTSAEKWGKTHKNPKKYVIGMARDNGDEGTEKERKKGPFEDEGKEYGRQ